jgi:hypothetical protein
MVSNRWIDPLKKSRASVHDKNNSEEQENNMIPIFGAGSHRPPPVNKYASSDQQRHPFYEKVKAWKEGVAIVIALCALTVSFYAYDATWRSSRAAQQSADAAQRGAATAEKALILSQRPWLTAVASLSTPVIFYENGQTYVGVRVLLKNVGHSVAVHAVVSTGVVLTSHRDGLSYEMIQAPEQRRKALCEEGHRGEDIPQGFVVFPEQEVSPEAWLLIGDVKSLKEWAVSVPHVPGEFITLLVVGCVSY